MLEKSDSPPSGISTTVVFTYRLTDGRAEAVSDGKDAFSRLRGTLKEVFQSLGGGEEFIRRERDNFCGPGKDT